MTRWLRRRKPGNKPPLTEDSMLSRAQGVAFFARQWEPDRSRRLAIEHLERVAALMDTDLQRTVAMLHDLLEDTRTTSTLDSLSHSFPVQVVSALDALTRRPEEPYRDYINRVAENPLARVVKLADLIDTADERRLALLPDEEAERLRLRYHEALYTLGMRHPAMYVYYRRLRGRTPGPSDGLLRSPRWFPWSPERLGPTGWQPGSSYDVDAVTGMGEDPWSSGESADEISEAEARSLADERGWPFEDVQLPYPLRADCVRLAPIRPSPGANGIELPPVPLEDLLPDADLVVIARVDEIREVGDPRGSDQPPGPVTTEPSQKVVLMVREVLHGTWNQMWLPAAKPPGPYWLTVQEPRYESGEDGHLFLLRRIQVAGVEPTIAEQYGLGGEFEILGRYGPRFLALDECLELLGHGGYPDCHDHPRRPEGYLEGVPWIRDPPPVLDFYDETRPGRESVSLHVEPDGTVTLWTHVGETVNDAVGRFTALAPAEAFVKSLCERTRVGTGIALAYDGVVPYRH